MHEYYMVHLPCTRDHTIDFKKKAKAFGISSSIYQYLLLTYLVFASPMLSAPVEDGLSKCLYLLGIWIKTKFCPLFTSKSHQEIDMGQNTMGFQVLEASQSPRPLASRAA